MVRGVTGAAADLGGRGRSRFWTPVRGRVLAAAVAVALLAAGILACREVWGVAVVEAALKEIDFTQDHSQYSPEDVAGKIARLSAAMER